MFNELVVQQAVSRETSRVVGTFSEPRQLGPDLWMMGISLEAPTEIRGSTIAAGDFLVLDPRCLITTPTGHVVYNPRMHLARMGKTHALWLAHHPEWPPRAEKGRRRSSLSPRLRFAIFKRDHYRCQLCGASSLTNKSVELEIDHKVPLAKGGTNHMDNLWVLCRPCNQGKSIDDLY